MSELLKYKRETESLESDTVYCANDDNLAVEYGLCEHCISTLTECPICEEKALDDGVICHYCGSVFIYSCKTFYVTIERVNGLKYYQFTNVLNDEIQNIIYDTVVPNSDFFDGIDITDFLKAIILCEKDFIEEYK